MTASFTDELSMSANIRREGSSRLGINQQWATFYGAGLSYDVSSVLKMKETDQLLVRTSYGKSGMIPTRSGLSADVKETVVAQNGQTTTRIIRAGNDELAHEFTTEINAGLSLNIGTLQATVDWYQRRNTGLVDFVRLDFNQVSEIYFNSIDLRSSGVDLGLQASVLQHDQIRWEVGLVGSYYQNKIARMATAARKEGFTQPPFPTSVTHVLAEGGSYGDFFGPVLTEVLPDGTPVFEDLNSDGVISLPRLTGLIEGTDATVLGNGLPSWEIGIRQSLQYANWRVTMMLRGAFGHSLLNSYRSTHEPISGLDELRNSPLPKDDDNVQSIIEYSSAYVESADFLTLDNMSVGYRFRLPFGPANRYLTATLSTQNLFTISGYSGFTPEPVLVDRGYSVNGSLLSDNTPELASAGIDHLNQYLPSRRYAFTLLFDL